MSIAGRIVAWALKVPPSTDAALAPDWVDPDPEDIDRDEAVCLAKGAKTTDPDVVTARTVGLLADDVDDLSTRLAKVERAGVVRIQRCDGLCPGDDCPACARADVTAGELQRLHTRIEVLEAALGVEQVRNRELRSQA
jgi:hypothetical protein